MKMALWFCLTIASTPGLARAERAIKVAPPLTEKHSRICDFMLANPSPAGRRVDDYQVAAEIAIPREQVAQMLKKLPPVEVPSLTQRFIAKIKSYLAPVAAPASREMYLSVKDMRDAQSPEVRSTLERVAARLVQIQSEAMEQPAPNAPVRHVLRGRYKIQKYLAKLALQAVVAEKKAKQIARPVEITSVPDLQTALSPEALARVDAEEPAPKFIEHSIIRIPGVSWSSIKDMSRIAAMGTAGGLAFTAMFAYDIRVSSPTVLVLGAGLSLLSAEVRGQVAGAFGRVKSLYRDWRTGPVPAPPTAEEIAQRRSDRLSIQINVLNEISKRMLGAEPEHGFSYYSYEAETSTQLDDALRASGRAVGSSLKLVEHVVQYDGTSHAMFTVITDLATGVPTFTQVELR